MSDQIIKIKTWQLNQRQALPLNLKIRYTQNRIRAWYEHWQGQVYISFSGGKDSTVLLYIVRELYPDIPAVFVDTGLEYPEIRAFVEQTENVTWLKPKMPFYKVIKKYGYPIISKDQSCAIHRYHTAKNALHRHRRLHGWPNGKRGMISKKWQFLIKAPFKISDQCCRVMKKEPLNRYAKQTNRKPMTAMMASESNWRKRQYMATGCNNFDSTHPISWPMAFWTDEDVWRYIRHYDLPYSEIYDMGETRTGCMFCMFGIQYDGTPNRFQRMKKNHPKQYDFCMKKLGCEEVLKYIQAGTNLPALI